MTAWAIPIPRLPGPAPVGPIICASEMRCLAGVAALLADARLQAGEMVRRAERDAASVCEAARRDGVAAAQRDIAALRAAAIDEAVEWLVEQRELEVVLAGRLESRLRALLAAELEALIDGQDPAGLLVQHLRQRLAGLPADEPLTLRVSPGQSEAVGQACAGLAFVHIVADHGLQAGQAVLDTPFARVVIDLEVHLQAVIARLRHGNRAPS